MSKNFFRAMYNSMGTIILMLSVYGVLIYAVYMCAIKESQTWSMFLVGYMFNQLVRAIAEAMKD